MTKTVRKFGIRIEGLDSSAGDHLAKLGDSPTYLRASGFSVRVSEDVRQRANDC